jgi:UDP-N-acetylmuramoyl-tripeptide--D-alanyl-D-alanine ligase
VSHRTSIEHGTTFIFSAEGREYRLELPQVVFGEYGVTIAAVLAAGKAVHIPYEKTIACIHETFSLPAGRFSVLAGKNGSILLDSSYNSSPSALVAALGFLSGQRTGKRIAILGDMRELGPLAEAKHREAVRVAISSADIIILVGPLMKEYGISELHDRKFPREKQYWFLTSQGVGDFVCRKLLAPGDTVLVKGSQNTIFLEEAVAELLVHPEDTVNLCRQSPYWDSVRHSFFRKNGQNLV